jgi:hypothetical protein
MTICNLTKKCTFSGGDGSSEDKAIIIHASSSSEGVEAEYEYLCKNYGERGVDWELYSQTFFTSDARKKIDVLEIRRVDGSVISVYFDISQFFRKVS